jgi:DNA repair exonuclease SbcCD ATPase subunit
MLKHKYERLMKKNNQLESESEELIIFIEGINEELKSSHEVIDNLNKELNKYEQKENDYEKLRSKWVDAKQIYQTKINELKSQLTHAGNMVPVDKYHQALESAEMFRKSLKDKEVEVQELSGRISQLEVLLGKSTKENTPTKNWKDVFSPPSKKNSGSRLTLSGSKLKKSQTGSGKKSSKGLRTRSALTPLQGNRL